MNMRPLNAQEARLDELLDKLITDATRKKGTTRVDELKRRRIVDRALLEADLETRRSKAHVIRLPLIPVAALIAASAAIIVMIWSAGVSKNDSSPEPISPSEAPIVAVNNERTGQNAKSASEPSHVHMEFAPGIKAVVTQDTQFTIDRTRLSRITVRISQGTMWVVKAPETGQTQLEIATPSGTVLVTGTVFSVYADKRSLRVVVLRGSVRVVEAKGPTHTVTAGTTVTLGIHSAEIEPISRPEKARAEFVQLGILAEDDLPIPHPDQRAPSKTESWGGQRSSSSDPGEPRVSARDLLSQISLLREQKDWAQMSITYRRLIRHHRKSPQAGLSMVSLGNLLTEKLDDPEEAIHWFDVYLKSKNGALAPEALFGKAKALRRLGNRKAELAVLQEIVKRYPESLYGKRAAEWIAQREQQ